MYLLDTNVISELRKGGRANHGVTAFFATLAAEDIYLSVVTIGEIRRGLENVRARGDREQAGRLEAGTSQDSCRLIHATNRPMSSA